MVGLVERTDINRGDDPLTPYIRPGIKVELARGRACLWLQYENDADADAAAEKLREALADAIWVSCPGTR